MQRFAFIGQSLRDGFRRVCIRYLADVASSGWVIRSGVFKFQIEMVAEPRSEDKCMAGCDLSGVLTLDVAREQLTSRLQPMVAVEVVPLAQALGRILAAPVVASAPLPGFDNSAMDGYAVRLADLQEQRVLPQVGKAFAGHPYLGEWPAGSCIRIMTGAPIPEGCEAVVMQEQTRCLVDSEQDGPRIEFLAQVRAGQNIRRQGEDVALGQALFQAGLRITARELPLLAALGCREVSVYRPLRVAYFSSGDELRPVGCELSLGQIVDSNRYAIAGMLQRLGCDALDLGIIPDDKDALRAAFLRADSEADVLITSGGVSVGEADYTKELLAELGEVEFWKVAIKPGKPFACGRLTQAANRRWFFGLPGNPVSAMVTFGLLVRPALERLMGQSITQPLRLQARTDSALRLSAGRIDFQRGIARNDESGQLVVTLAGGQGSAMFTSLSQANCLIRLDPDCYPGEERLPAGSIVTIELFDEVLK